MQFILSLETATPVCSVALKSGDTILSRTSTGTGIHSEATFLFTEELLKEAGLPFSALDAVIISGGPGSYTGLRIASAAVKGMLFSSKATFYAADTLASVAVTLSDAVQYVTSPVRIHTVLNARRTHLYHQIFLKNPNQSIEPVCKPAIRSLAQISGMMEANDLLGGTGIERLPEELLKQKNVTTFHDEEALKAETLIQMLLKPSYAAWVQRSDPRLYEPLYTLEEAG